MAFLRKYGTGTGADVWVPLVKRGVVDFAVSADWTPAAGDVKISIDGGAAANIGTLPTALTMGNAAVWKFVFADAELQGKVITVTVSDSATKAVEDQCVTIETYGHPSAKFIADLALANLPANILAIDGSTAAATAQKKAALCVGYGTVDAGASTTSIPIKTINGAIADADQLKGRTVVFPADAASGLKLQAAEITAVNATGPVLTVSPALTQTPAEDAEFMVF